MVEDHNKAVADLESHLVKYLKGGQMGKKRPTMRKGGFMGMGGEKKVCSLMRLGLMSGCYRLFGERDQIPPRQD